MNTRRDMLVVLCIFAGGAVVNTLYGSLIANYKCWNGPCTQITQMCITGGAACRWCNTSGSGDYCGETYEAICNSGEDKNCGGTSYTGTCNPTTKKCVGTLDPNTGCIWPACSNGSPIPQPG